MTRMEVVGGGRARIGVVEETCRRRVAVIEGEMVAGHLTPADGAACRPPPNVPGDQRDPMNDSELREAPAAVCCLRFGHPTASDR